ncbi:MAG TPA: type I methionyl aminopeptidase [Kofleriaceae bacterium]|nr:type I methionyl aminopeptidase [Kofleriaceae bacterium]
MGIVLRSEDEIARIGRAGEVVARVLDAVEAACVPGVTTRELERIAARELAAAKGESVYIGYAPGGAPPYPSVLCTSINEEVVHGIPSGRALREGDVIGIDFACAKDGWVADGARTIGVGVVSAAARGLVDKTRAALDAAIERAVVGARLGDLGDAISRVAGGSGIVRAFTGHGVGRRMHEPPAVPNVGRAGTGTRLKAGLVIAIEPMFTLGSGDVEIADDGWTVKTIDRSWAAHYEHTIAITARGPRVLTSRT